MENKSKFFNQPWGKKCKTQQLDKTQNLPVSQNDVTIEQQIRDKHFKYVCNKISDRQAQKVLLLNSYNIKCQKEILFFGK